MSKSYTYLTQEERYQIYAYKKAGYSHFDIGEMLGRHVSTIRRATFVKIVVQFS